MIFKKKNWKQVREGRKEKMSKDGKIRGKWGIKKWEGKVSNGIVRGEKMKEEKEKVEQ